MNKLRYIILSCVLLAFAGSCTYNFDDYNDNPNQMEEGNISPASMLEDVLYLGAEGFLDRTRGWNGEIMQYTVSGTTVNSYHRYAINNGVMSSVWNHLFQYASDADHMYQLAMQKEIAEDNVKQQAMNDNIKAIALTMKCLFLSNATDIFGDIPYSEAFKSREGNFKPVFDTQKDVYTGILKELDEANSLYVLTESITHPAKDLMYGGKIIQWKKFTNSLRLRLLMRLSNRDAEMKVFAEIKKIIEDPANYPVFENNADNAALFYSGAAPFTNFYGADDERSFQNDRKTAENIITRMNSVNDPRLPFYFLRSGNKDWKGLPSGEVFQEGDNDDVSTIYKKSLGLYTSPYAFMKSDEVEFIKAEAAKRGIIAGGDAVANDHYNNALLQSITWWHAVTKDAEPLETSEVTDFITVRAAYDNTLQIILDQKYVALFWVGYEAWHEYRRTGFPQLRIGSATDANNFIFPTRFAYPINVSTTNPANYAIAVERIAAAYKGKDNMQSPVWWSRRAILN